MMTLLKNLNKRTMVIVLLLVFCCVLRHSRGLATDIQEASTSAGAAKQALKAARENGMGVASANRALFRQRLVLKELPVFILEFGWDGGRRFQRTQHEGETDHRVYDGDATRALTTSSRRASLYVTNDAQAALHGWAEVYLNTMFPLSQHWWSKETERRVPGRFEWMGEETVGETLCFVFAGIGRTSENKPLAVRVWIDPSGRVRQMEDYAGGFDPKVPVAQALKNANLRRRISYRKYQRHGRAHVPTLLEVQGFGEWVDRTITTELVDFQPKFTADTFTLTIAEGTEVYDATHEPPLSYTYPAEQMSEAELEQQKAEMERGYAERREVERAQQGLIGKPAPELAVQEWFNSEPLSIEGLKGKWVLLEFTSIACGPCLSAIPFLNEAVDEFKNKPVQIVSVHAHVPAATYPDIQAYIEKHGIKYPLGISSEGEEHGWGSVFGAYSVYGIPCNVLINPDGRVVSHQAVWDALAELRKKLIWGETTHEKPTRPVPTKTSGKG